MTLVILIKKMASKHIKYMILSIYLNSVISILKKNVILLSKQLYLLVEQYKILKT